MVALLASKGANVNGSGGTSPLHKAASTGKKEIVEILLANKANINISIAFGDTPLDWAIRNNREDIIKILIQNGGKTGEQLDSSN